MPYVPEFEKVPYQEEKIKSRNPEDLAEYIKNLVSTVEEFYATLAGAINQISGGAVGPHKTTHEDGGVDEINVGSLSGELTDPQSPKTHKATHQDGGGDELSVAGLNGELTDPQPPKTHKVSHQNGGADEISVASLSGKLADEQDAGDIKAKPVDAPLAGDDGKYAKYDHGGSKIVWDTPTGGNCKIKTGTYTGDGTEGQAVTGVGFLGKFGWIFKHPTGESTDQTVLKLDRSWGDYAQVIQSHDTLQVISRASRMNSLDADGFTVDDGGVDAHPNKNGQVYDYLILG